MHEAGPPGLENRVYQVADRDLGAYAKVFDADLTGAPVRGATTGAVFVMRSGVT
jgi:hypothetical protein